eukprot:GEMP01008189.1.p1 GENE.GEMP01008189.1~~GEMP01008189.1.p1  ORF type:complete len:754 (+),score=156.17 GEMP01008189.1:270-2531(+)
MEEEGVADLGLSEPQRVVPCGFYTPFGAADQTIIACASNPRRGLLEHSTRTEIRIMNHLGRLRAASQRREEIKKRILNQVGDSAAKASGSARSESFIKFSSIREEISKLPKTHDVVPCTIPQSRKAPVPRCVSVKLEKKRAPSPFHGSEGQPQRATDKDARAYAPKDDRIIFPACAPRADDTLEAGRYAAKAKQSHSDIMEFRLSNIQDRISANLALPPHGIIDEPRKSSVKPSPLGHVTGTLRNVLCGSKSSLPLSPAPAKTRSTSPEDAPGIAKPRIVAAHTLKRDKVVEALVSAASPPTSETVHVNATLEQCVDIRMLNMFRKVHLVDPPFDWVTTETTIIDGSPVATLVRTPRPAFLQRNDTESPKQMHATPYTARSRDSTSSPPMSPAHVRIMDDSSPAPMDAAPAPLSPLSRRSEETDTKKLTQRPVTKATVSVVRKLSPRPQCDVAIKRTRTNGLQVKKWLGSPTLRDQYGVEMSLLEKAASGMQGIRRSEVFLETLDTLCKAHAAAAATPIDQEASDAYARASPGRTYLDSDIAFQPSSLSPRVEWNQQLRRRPRNRGCRRTRAEDNDNERPHSHGATEENRPQSRERMRPQSRGAMKDNQPQSRERMLPHSRGDMEDNGPQSRELMRPHSRGAMSAPASCVAQRPSSTETWRKRKVAGFTTSQLASRGKTHGMASKKPVFVELPKSQMGPQPAGSVRQLPQQGSIRFAKWHKAMPNGPSQSTNEHLPMTISSLFSDHPTTRTLL